RRDDGAANRSAERRDYRVSRLAMRASLRGQIDQSRRALDSAQLLERRRDDVRHIGTRLRKRIAESPRSRQPVREDLPALLLLQLLQMNHHPFAEALDDVWIRFEPHQSREARELFVQDVGGHDVLADLSECIESVLIEGEIECGELREALRA